MTAPLACSLAWICGDRGENADPPGSSTSAALNRATRRRSDSSSRSPFQ